jgi:2-phospho-L-lactate guanylyltransferase
VSAPAWIIILIKDLDSAKSRLTSVLLPAARRQLALTNAQRAVDAAINVGPTLAICGSDEAARVAAALGAEVIVESSPSGQNAAGATGLVAASARGAKAALLLSSDLPLVDSAALERMLARAATLSGPVAVAAAAIGRRGTNALFLRPMDNFDLHFGDASLLRFADEARRRARMFVVHQDPCLGLDLDEPGDLAAWEELRKMA